MNKFACVARIDFSDGGNPEFRILYEGTKEECERVYDMNHAAVYSGPRRATQCRIGIFKERDLADETNE